MHVVCTAMGSKECEETAFSHCMVISWNVSISDTRMLVVFSTVDRFVVRFLIFNPLTKYYSEIRISFAGQYPYIIRLI